MPSFILEFYAHLILRLIESFIGISSLSLLKHSYVIKNAYVPGY